MLSRGQLETLADGEAAKVCEPRLVRRLHQELSRAGALGEIAWQLRLVAQEKWQRGYPLGRTGLEAQLKKDAGGLNWGWDEIEERGGDKDHCAPAESVSILVIDLPVGQVGLREDYYAGRRLPPYRGRIDGCELTDLRIAAFVELVLQHQTLDEVRQAVARLAVPGQEATVTLPTAAPESFDAVLDAALEKPRAPAKTTVTATGEARPCPKCGELAAVYLRAGKRTLYCRSCATRRRGGER